MYDKKKAHSIASMKWAKKNPDKKKLYARNYYLKNRLRLNQYGRDWVEKNKHDPEYIQRRREQQRKYLKSHPPTPYIRIRKNKKQVKEHRWIMEQHLGRKLLKTEIIHHLDGNKQNNDISNLAIMTLSSHTRFHHLKTK